MRSAKRSFLLPLLGLLCAAVAIAESPYDGHWQGAIQLPGQALEIDVDLASAGDGTLSGDISIPAQNTSDFPLSGVTADGTTIRFKMAGVPGEPSFQGQLSEDGSRITGTFTQGGASLTFELSTSGGADQARAALGELGTLIERAVRDFNVPGLGIAVVVQGEVVYAEGFGYRNLEEELPMTPDTLFAIGSTTKAMTATLLGMLVDEGKLAWDEPLRSYLPRFALTDPMVSTRITPRDLVTHRSGMPRHDLLWYNNNQTTRAEMVARLAHLELTADLRERFQYNNLMFMTAGYLGGELLGSSWEDALRTRLFEPLGMKRSNFSVADSQRDPNHALPYRENDDDELEAIPFRSIDVVGPAGSVNSSVNEMARWLRFNLEGGKVNGGQLVNRATLADIHSPHMPTPGASPRPDITPVGYGMGWLIDIYRGHRRVSHGGGIDGFVTSVMLFPDQELGLVSFVNRGSGLGSLINQHAADRILGLDEVDWTGEALERAKQGEAVAEEAEKKRDALRLAGTSPSHPIADYTGSYGHPGYGTLGVAAGEGKDALTLTFNGITAPFEHWHYDVWNGAETDGDSTFEDTKFLFRGNLEGQIAAVEASLEPTAAPIVFEKMADPLLSDPAVLARFVGRYSDGVSGQIGEIALTGDVLTLHLPGQPAYTLVPHFSGRFAIEGLEGFAVGFVEDDAGAVTKVVYYQPNGVFEAQRLKE